MSAQLYEIRQADNGKPLLLNAKPGAVSRFFSKHKIRTVRDQKIGGVIVIFVVPDVVPA